MRFEVFSCSISMNLLQVYSMVDAASESLKGRQLSLVIWALASLKYTEPDKIQQLVDLCKPSLLSLQLRDLASMMSALAKAGVRPSNPWLGTAMQAAHIKMHSATCRDLAQFLCGLVKAGVKPSLNWLAGYMDAVAAAAPSAAGVDLVVLLTALSEARHKPSAEWGDCILQCVAPQLCKLDMQHLVDLVAAMRDMELSPSHGWLMQYYEVTANKLSGYKPWQLATSMLALGAIGTGVNASQDCAAAQAGWVHQAVAAAMPQLASFGARDMSAFLCGLQALHARVGHQVIIALLQESLIKLPRFNGDGLSRLLGSLLLLTGKATKQQSPLNSSGIHSGTASIIASTPPAAAAAAGSQVTTLNSQWMEAYLREIAVKLPVFGAEELTRILVAVAQSGYTPTSVWSTAAAKQLQGKLTILGLSDLVNAVAALVQVGHVPDGMFLNDVMVAALKQELRPRELYELLKLLVQLDAVPPAGWVAAVRTAVQDWQQQNSRDAPGMEVHAGVSHSQGNVSGSEDVAPMFVMLDLLQDRGVAWHMITMNPAQTILTTATAVFVR